MQLHTVPGGLKYAVNVLRNGGIVAFPTDTVYGLAANIMNPKAVLRVYHVKRRPLFMPLPVLISEMDELDQVATDISDSALALANQFWPGALTLILKASRQIPTIVTGGTDTVAVRLPDHTVPRTLVAGLGYAITGTSANLNGQSEPITGEGVYRSLGNQVDYIIDDSNTAHGKPSTILDLSGLTPRLLRQGVISLEEINDVCGATSI